MGRELSLEERKVLEEFLKKELQAHTVTFSELAGPAEYGWQGEKIIFETSTHSFEIWRGNKIWTVWVEPFEHGYWFSYSPSVENLPDVFGNRSRLKKLCSILKVRMRRYQEI